jgi:hypothetical protein
MRKTILSSALLAAMGMVGSANAALVNDGSMTLSIDLGTGSCAAGGTFPNCTYGANVATGGSYFTMDGNFGAILESDLGIVLGTTQDFSGTAPSSGNPYDGSGTNITAPWSFFGNTGTNFSVSAVSANSDTEIDMSGWRVAWGEVPSINMGAAGTGTIACGACTYGSTYTLNYTSTVPPGDPSGFGGVVYALQLTGTILGEPEPPEPIPVPAAVWLFGSGLVGLVGVARRRKRA